MASKGNPVNKAMEIIPSVNASGVIKCPNNPDTWMSGLQTSGQLPIADWPMTTVEISPISPNAPVITKKAPKTTAITLNMARPASAEVSDSFLRD